MIVYTYTGMYKPLQFLEDLCISSKLALRPHLYD